MGLMRFIVTPPERLTDEMVGHAYLSGIDRLAWQVRARADGDQLVLERSVSDTGNLHVPWEVEGHGRPTLSTACLNEEFGPHHLPLELARGTVGQLRNQLAEWRVAGLDVAKKITEKEAEATALLGRAATSQDRRVSGDLAQQALRAALDAADLLTATYADQAAAVRLRGGAKLPTVLGGDLGISLLDDRTAGQFPTCFNMAVMPLCWREVEATEGSYYWTVCDKQIEWCRSHNLKVCGGPLLKLDARSLPDWLFLWEGDFENVLSFVSDFITAAVQRYRGKVDLWVCSSRMNSADLLSLSEQEKLRLAARSIELIRAADPDTPVVISFDQPWAEYMSRRQIDFPPLHFADALVRAGLGISGLMLEINVGGAPGGTLPRIPLELGRQVDHWSIFGLPLLVSFSAPSADGDDPSADRQTRHASGIWTPQSQQAWAARNVPLLLAKPYVEAIFWNQLRDAEPHDFPHAGLFDADGNAKPALQTLASIRQTYLK
ncbi:MAG: endo-1,4-beta-xylanase [Candidatus Nealsonbacteria bacterium]|nr:endo-1,4-beta-xylanase [Candidatus Nealsonbacteria bacterium]